MTKAEVKFLAAYRYALSGGQSTGNNSNIIDDFDSDMTISEFHQVMTLADSHHIYPMIFESLYFGTRMIGERSIKYKHALIKAEKLACGQAIMSAEFLKLYQFLSKKGLDPIVMKGIICRDLYLKPELRPSTDEDLLIPEAEFSKYHNAFIEYGLRPAMPQLDFAQEHEIPYRNSQVYIELHKKPFPPESKAYGDLNRFFMDVWEHKTTVEIYGVPITTMDNTYHLFFLLCHAYKHFMNCGIGIRIVSDIVLYSMKYIDQIEWDKIAKQCRDIKAYDFIAALYKIGEKYLFPETFPEMLVYVWNTADVNEKALLKDILTGGLYGTSSEDRLHSSNLTLYAVQNEKTGRQSSTLLMTVFPSYNKMKKRYSWLRKYPMLLPAAWLHRIASYSSNNVLRAREGHKAIKAMRIGNDRVALMRQYRILEENREGITVPKRFLRWIHSTVFSHLKARSRRDH